MASRDHQAGEGYTHPGIVPAMEDQNAAAWEGPSSRPDGPTSSMGDRKRSEAAQLARELGSSGPWSEAFIPEPQTDGSLPTQHTITSHEHREELDNIHTRDMAQSQQELDPPPAYSNVPPVHELPASPVNAMPPASLAAACRREAPSNLQADLEQNESHGEQEQDDRAPLLGRVRRRPNQRGWGRWVHNGKTPRQRHFRLLALVVAFSLVASVIVCAFVDGFNDDTLGSSDPLKPALPFVPTGPEYEQHQTFENIHGAYKLYNRLDLSTTTGSIDIAIDPQPGDQPAVLMLSSDTGSITLRISSDYLHRRHKAARAIHTEIRSLTGTVNAAILLGHGSYALVDTRTGAQVLSVMGSGMGRHDEVSNLTTYSNTGAQRVTMTSVDAADEPLTNLRAEHHSFATASLDITYPPVWLGKVHAIASLFGHVDVQGDNLEYIKQDGSEVIAYRGPVRHRQKVEAISDGTGRVSFKC